VILVKVDALSGLGNAQVAGYDDKNWFIADSFGFGVEREMKESGEKGGTEDINIGVGELQECTISKSMDSTSTLLAQFAVNGNNLGTAEINFLEGSRGKPLCYLKYKLDRCFVKSWSTSSDADDRPTEEVAFYFNRIAAVTPVPAPAFSWDQVANRPWTGHNLTPPA
jgi:type VI protein secretion system component Hcp